MQKVRSHYENLKVARDAPPEVIRAAYRSLSQKYHPDRNPANNEAVRIMAILNAAYETLSDPIKKRAHDQWIASAESNGGTEDSSGEGRDSAEGEPKRKERPDPSRSGRYKAGRVFSHIIRNSLWYGIGLLFLWGWANDKPATPPPDPKPYQATPALPQARPAYVRPTMAPNGQPWPTKAAYVKGYERLHVDGLSTVTVDNSKNDSDVFVKLVSLDGSEAYPVRTFFIPAYGNFTTNKVTAGSYDIRYRDLDSGWLSRSESFELKEIPTKDGTQFSNMTMTLYKVKNGNMQSYALSEAEF